VPTLSRKMRDTANPFADPLRFEQRNRFDEPIVIFGASERSFPPQIDAALYRLGSTVSCRLRSRIMELPESKLSDDESAIRMHTLSRNQAEDKSDWGDAIEGRAFAATAITFACD